MSKLFISYRRKSWAFTDRLANDLRNILDAEIFVDFTGMDETDFESSILRNLRESDAVLLIITEHTFASERIHHDDDWVRREIREALVLNKPLILACVDGLFPPNDVPDDIQGVRRMEGIRFFPEYFESGVQRLSNFIIKTSKIPLRSLAPAPQPSKVAPGGQRTLDEAEALHNEGRYSEAVILLEELRASGYKSRFINLDALIEETQKQRDDALRHEEAVREYKEIATLARMAKTLVAEAQAREAWEQFCAVFPDLFEVLDNEQILSRRFAQTRPNLDIAKLPKPVFTLPLLEWINIPAGKIKLEKVVGGFFEVAPFAIGKYPVTNAQFNAFIADRGYKDTRWWEGLTKSFDSPEPPRWPTEDHPRESISWYEAMAFCRWLSAKLEREIILPTEMQWQRAAQGEDGRRYPWGDQFHESKCNASESNIGRTTPVTQYPTGASPFGVMDMSGNVWEWCLNFFDEPGKVDGRNDNNRRAVRGGSFFNGQDGTRAAFRLRNLPHIRQWIGGFRVVCTTPIE